MSIVERRPRVLTAPLRWGRKRWTNLLLSALVLLLTLGYLLPIFLMLVMSVKSQAEYVQNPLALPQRPTLENFSAVIAQMQYLRAIANTIGITLASTVLIVIIAPLAAYPLARTRARWTNLIYQGFIAGLTIPLFVVMLPLYSVMKTLGLLNTYQGVVLLYTALNLPLAIFFYTGFIRSVPVELEEAAAIDGCSPLLGFWYIVLPLLRPITATLAMFVTLSVWNDFLLPLVFLFKPEARTIMVSVYSFVGEYGFQPTTLFPAAVLASLPLLIFFFVLQKQIIAGVSAGAVKG